MDYRFNYKTGRYKALAFVCLCFFTPTAYAQDTYKKSAFIKEIKSNMKNKAYARVTDNVRSALQKFPDVVSIDPEYYYYNIQACHALALEEEKKMYLGQKADTVKYFDYVYTVFTDGTRCDSLANIPNQKGRVLNSYYKHILSLISDNMAKLPAGARFSFQKKNYQRAYDYATMFLRIAEDSLRFQQCKAPAAEVHSTSAIAVLSAYAQGKYRDALPHLPMALNENTRHRQILEIACRCYEGVGDTLHFEHSLSDGVSRYPSDSYFFLSLVKLYNDQHRYADVLEQTKRMLQIDSQNRDLWYIRGKEETYLSRDDEALQSFVTATEIKTDDAESYSAIGNIYLNMSRKAYEQQSGLTGKNLQNKKNELHNLYLKSKAAFESARQYKPQDTALWLSGLKEIYFKLNMGKELKAIEKMR